MSEKSDFMLKIGTAEDQAEADFWQAILDAEGIPCLVKNRNPYAYSQAALPFLPFALDVYVPRSAERRARQVLAPSLKPRRGKDVTPEVKQAAIAWLAVGPGWLLVGMAALLAVGVIAFLTGLI
jgi:Putative prokaryotic signal transducing protein